MAFGIFLMMALVFLQQRHAAQIKLQIHYETLSTSSQIFIVKELYPTLIALGGIYNNWLDVELVPYGLARTTWTTDSSEPVTTCHNGERECRENKLHSCALRKLRFEDALSFINCSLANINLPKGSLECGKTILGVDYKKITSCAESWEGDVLLAANGVTTQTIDPSIAAVPHIKLFGHFTTHAFEADGETDWVGLLCKRWKAGGATTLPSLCEGKAMPPP